MSSPAPGPAPDPASELGPAYRRPTAGLTPKLREPLALAACLPADTSTLPPLPDDVARFAKPNTDDTLKKCENVSCGQDIWVAPRKLALAEAGQVILLCFVCAIRVAGPDAPRVDLHPGRIETPRTT